MSLTKIRKAEVLGREATKKDFWMTPDADNKGMDDQGRDRLQREIEGWTKTDHYRVFWQKRIMDLVSKKLQGTEAGMHEFQGLEDAFFAAWLAAHDKMISRRKRAS